LALLPKSIPKSDYKKPRRINAVSVGLLIFMAAVVYVLWGLYPVFKLRAAVKGELSDALPTLWLMNLRPPDIAVPELKKLKTNAYAKIKKLGVRDPKLEITFFRSKKVVAIEAHFTLTAFFPWLKKTRAIYCTPRVETDAARVEW
jgi:hypothetical protein